MRVRPARERRRHRLVQQRAGAVASAALRQRRPPTRPRACSRARGRRSRVATPPTVPLTSRCARWDTAGQSPQPRLPQRRRVRPVLHHRRSRWRVRRPGIIASGYQPAVLQRACSSQNLTYGERRQPVFRWITALPGDWESRLGSTLGPRSVGATLGCCPIARAPIRIPAATTWPLEVHLDRQSGATVRSGSTTIRAVVVAPGA